jgi:pimeloyl-ACP methyl ester carboxylesterase
LLLVLIILFLIWWFRPRKALEGIAPDGPESLIPAADTYFYMERYGSGPPLVLLHGIGASTFTWRLVQPELAKSFDVINLDLPGFGRSAKDVTADYGLDAQCSRLLSLLDELKIQEAYLMGCSMGGALALWLARLQPSRFPKVLALAPATSPEKVWLKWQTLRWAFPAAPKIYNKKLLGYLYRRVITNPDLMTEDVLNGYHRPYTEPNSVITFLKATETLADPRLPTELAHVTSQVALAFGTSDKLVSLKEIERLQNILPNSELHLHQGGHHLQEDDPEWVIQLARDFFFH